MRMPVVALLFARGLFLLSAFSRHKCSFPAQVGELIVGPAKAKGPAVSLSDLVKVKTLGTGTFGRVKLVQHRKTKQVCSEG